MLGSTWKFIKHLLKVAATVCVAVFSMFVSVFVVMLIFIALGVGLASMSEPDGDIDHEYEQIYGESNSRHKIVVLPINGLILGSRDEVTPLFELFSDMQITYGYEIKQTLAELAEDDDVEAVILEINSPGGTIYGSQAIADGVANYRSITSKPIISYVSGLAASGGYWSAAAGDEIYADAGTSIGSIGVIMGPFKYYRDVVSESMTFGGSIDTAGGISTEYLTAGLSKDLGNPYRELTVREREVLQGGLDDSYQKFVGFVAEKREIERNLLIDQIGALLYSDVQAKEIGLIDGTMAKEAAYELVAERAEQDNYSVVRPRSELGFFESLAGVLVGNLGQKAAGLPIQQTLSLCHNSRAILVYDGDLADICR